MKCPNCKQVLYSNNIKICPFCGKEISQDENVQERKPKMFDIYGDQRGKKLSSTGEKLSFSKATEEQKENIAETVHAFQYKSLRTEQVDNRENALPNEGENSEVTSSAFSDSSSAPSLKTELFDEAEKNLEKEEVISANFQEENFIQTDSEAETDNKDKRKNRRSFLSFRGRKKAKSFADSSKEKSLHAADQMAEIENSSQTDYDTNYDGYYDDLIPEVAKQINKIPQENIIKAICIGIFVIIGSILILVTST